MGSSVPKGAKPLPADSDARSRSSGPAGLVARASAREVGVRVAPVHEAFAPGPQGELAIGHGEPFEIDGGEEPEPVPRRRRGP